MMRIFVIIGRAFIELGWISQSDVDEVLATKKVNNFSVSSKNKNSAASIFTDNRATAAE
jgi:hypothetical protein